MFVDRVKLSLRAGRGGDGVIAWRREKYIPKGGPCGGNGGNGGSVTLIADDEIPSLEWYRNKRLLKADNGQPGGSNRRHGKNGENLVLKVPCGTLVKDVRTGEILHDFIADKDRLLICRGGRGGKGNDSFKTPTNRAPHIRTEGKDGDTIEIELELKLIADVGLIGFPNAGKSTLISALTRVKVKIAPYPFTTLKPNLGYIQSGSSKILIADIPGIIEGANQNRGLGIEFLRHIERTRLLIYVLDASGIDGRNPAADFQILRNELTAYNPELLERPYLVVLNKMDVEESQEFSERFREECNPDPALLFEISAANRTGLDPLIEAIERIIFP